MALKTPTALDHRRLGRWTYLRNSSSNSPLVLYVRANVDKALFLRFSSWQVKRSAVDTYVVHGWFGETSATTDAHGHLVGKDSFQK